MNTNHLLHREHQETPSAASETTFLLQKLLPALARDPEASRWQALLNLGYREWQKDGNGNWDYAQMVAWAADTYGRAIKFFILIGKYNHQVGNGGHSQYFQNGFADGTGGFGSDHDPGIPLHRELVELFDALGLRQVPIGAKVFDIIKDFRIVTPGDEEGCEPAGGGDIANADELEQLDRRYYEVNEEFCAWLETHLRRWLQTGTNPAKINPQGNLPTGPRGLVRPTLRLSGTDGNAFSILARAERALKEAGFPSETILAFRTQARAGDYDHLLATTMRFCEVE